MGNLLLGRQLLHLVQQDVHLELGAQVLEATVAERLPAEDKDDIGRFVGGHTGVERRVREKEQLGGEELTPGR